MRATTARIWLVAIALGAVLASGLTPAWTESAVGHGTGPIATLEMVSPSTGWGWGPGIVVRTADGTATLIDVTPRRPGTIVDGAVLDASHAWIVTTIPGSTALRLLRTRDAGATWTSAPFPGSAGSLTFVDARHGWAHSSRSLDRHRASLVTLWRTLDGGATWSSVYQTRQRLTIEPDIQTGDCEWSSLRFSTPLHGVAALSCPKNATPKIDVTDDGGKTWRRDSLPVPSHPRGTTLFTTVQPPFVSGRDETTLVIVCTGSRDSCYEYGSVYRSSDGGKTWSRGRMLSRAGGPAVFADPTHVWIPDACSNVCGPTPLLLRTQDAGMHWTSSTLPRPLWPNMHGDRQFQFVSPSVGFVMAGQEFDPRTHFYRTTDGGLTFHAFQPHIVHLRSYG